MTTLVVYFDYKSPYAFVAKNLIREVGSEFNIEVEWRPYTIHISDFFGSAEVDEHGQTVADNRDAHQRRRVKYFYMDCRRLAKQRGLTFRPPRTVFESQVANIGMLFARRHGKFDRYHDEAFARFWNRELNVDSVEEVSQLLLSIGVDTESFRSFVEGEGRIEHDRIIAEAHDLGVFGVPSFILDGELYWGAEHLSAIRDKLRNAT